MNFQKINLIIYTLLFTNKVVPLKGVNLCYFIYLGLGAYLSQITS